MILPDSLVFIFTIMLIGLFFHCPFDTPIVVSCELKYEKVKNSTHNIVKKKLEEK